MRGRWRAASIAAMPTIYVPMLKAKGGELAALKDLTPGVRAQLFPVFDVAEVPWDFEAEAPAKSLDEHLAKLPDNLFKSIGSLPCAIDLSDLAPTDRMASGAHPITWLFGELRAKGVIAIPVVGPGYDAAYVTAAAQEIANDKRGCVVRVVGQARVFDPGLTANLAGVLASVGLREGDADLVLDVQSVPSGSETAIAFAAAAVVRALAALPAWRSLILAAASFPKDLSGYGQGMFVLPRSCWLMWNQLRGLGVPRLPTFGDYAIDHHDRSEPDVDPKFLKGSTNVRYTVSAEWLVPKGPNWKDHSFAPMVALCSQLAADPQFSGAAFSAGDAYIAACAGGGPTGNATTWRRVGVNHHVTFVVDQYARLLAASAATGQPLVGPGAVPTP